jgi:hypothetical protein
MLQKIMEPHSRLASQLLGLVRSHSTADPTHEYQTAAVIVFLAGVDKALSLALEALYLAGHVKWDWLRGRRGSAHLTPGEIVCAPGFMAKLDRLKDLGCDLRDLAWLAEMRNSYVHDCTILGGYRVAPDANACRLTLRPFPLTVQGSGPFLLALSADDIAATTEEVVERLGRLLSEKDCEEAWRKVNEQAALLPTDPQPWTDQVNAPRASADEIHEIVRALNAEAVGEGCAKLLPPPQS